MSGSERNVLLAERTSAELARIAPDATLVIPIGATEQHGPHLPVGVDAMVADRLARRAAVRVSTAERPVLVAPALAYGSSHHHLPLAGTLSLTSRTLHSVLLDLLLSASAGGFRRFLVLNGHGGNDDIARQAARDITTSHDVVAVAAGYWSLASDRLAERASASGIGLVPGHAGAFETSLVLAAWPDLVERSLPVRDTGADRAGRPLGDIVIERHGWVRSLDGGFTDSPGSADLDAGIGFMDLLVDACADLLLTLSAIEVTP